MALLFFVMTYAQQQHTMSTGSVDFVAVLGRVQLPVISTRAASVLSYVVHAVPCSMCRALQPRCILLVSC